MKANRASWKLGALGAASLFISLAVFAAEPAPRSAAEWGGDLASGDRAQKREAAYQLSHMGKEARPALPQLIEALGDEQQQVWFGAVTALANLGPDAEPALPALLKELDAWQPFRKDRQGTQALYRTAVALGSIGAPAIPALSNGLASDKWFVRAGSARALGFATNDALPVLPKLVQCLADERAEVRDATAETLAILGSASVAPLAEILRAGESTRARAAAADALGRLGHAAAAATPALEAAMDQDREVIVRVAALQAHARVSTSQSALVPRLMAAWTGGPPEVRQAARSALLLVRPVETTSLPAVLPLLESKDAETRTAAAGFLADLGPDARSAVVPLVELVSKPGESQVPDPALTRALAAIGEPALPPIFSSLSQRSSDRLGSNDWTLSVVRRMPATAVLAFKAALTNSAGAVRLAALEGLTALGPDARPAIRQLPPLLDDPEPAVRARAWLAAGACGVPSETLLKQLEAGLNDSSPEVRRAVASGVARLGRSARPAVPRLMQELASQEAGLQLAVVRALAALGPEAEAAAGPLADRLGKEDAALDVEVLRALGSIGPAAAAELPRMAETSKSTEATVRRAYLEAVGRFKDSAKEALVQVEQALDDNDPAVRAAALGARVAVDPGSEGAVKAAMTALDDPDESVRRAAVDAIGKLEEKGRPAEAKLFALLEDGSLRGAARDALRAIHPTSVSTLVTVLAHPDSSVREMAADSLGRIGKGAADAIPALEKAVREDPYDDVKRASRRALRRIREG